VTNLKYIISICFKRIVVIMAIISTEKLFEKYNFKGAFNLMVIVIMSCVF